MSDYCKPEDAEELDRRFTGDLRPKAVSSNALLAQMIRREISTLEWITACANRDLQQYGEWQCNWAEYQGEIQQTLDRLFSRANPTGQERIASADPCCSNNENK